MDSRSFRDFNITPTKECCFNCCLIIQIQKETNHTHTFTYTVYCIIIPFLDIYVKNMCASLEIKDKIYMLYIYLKRERYGI